MHTPRNTALLAEQITSIALEHSVDYIATLGSRGFCGHADHIASHVASLMAQEQLRRGGRLITVLALHHLHAGELKIAVASRKKQVALAYHETQMATITTPKGRVLKPRFRQYFMHALGYGPLFAQETYDILRPRQ